MSRIPQRRIRLLIFPIKKPGHTFKHVQAALSAGLLFLTLLQSILITLSELISKPLYD